MRRVILAALVVAGAAICQAQETSFDSLLETARAQSRAGSHKDAIATLDRARKLAPSHPKAMLDLSQAYRDAGDRIGSAMLLMELSAQQPQNVELAFQLGKAYRALGAWSADQLRAHHPDSARVHQLTAEAYAMNARPDAAIAEYKKALEKSPSLPGSHLGLAAIYASRRQWDEARQAIQAELKIAPHSAAARAFAAMLETAK